MMSKSILKLTLLAFALSTLAPLPLQAGWQDWFKNGWNVAGTACGALAAGLIYTMPKPIFIDPYNYKLNALRLEQRLFHKVDRDLKAIHDFEREFNKLSAIRVNEIRERDGYGTLRSNLVSALEAAGLKYDQKTLNCTLTKMSNAEVARITYGRSDQDDKAKTALYEAFKGLTIHACGATHEIKEQKMDREQFMKLYARIRTEKIDFIMPEIEQAKKILTANLTNYYGIYGRGFCLTALASITCLSIGWWRSR